MRIGLTQFETVWEDIDSSMEKCEACFQEAKMRNVDILCFPEFTLTGFTQEPEKYCDTPENPRMKDFFIKKSAEYNMAFVFGYIEAAEPNPLNKLAIVKDGVLLFDYAKLHSYSFGHENEHYSRGAEIKHTEIDGFGIGAHICFDLRFPEIFQVSANKSDIIFVIGNWPQNRIENWYTLLRARALETQCYIVGTNRSGEGGGVEYAPSSVAFDPAGTRVTEDSDDLVITFDADLDVVRSIREGFPLRMDRRESLYVSLYKQEFDGIEK